MPGVSCVPERHFACTCGLGAPPCSEFNTVLASLDVSVEEIKGVDIKEIIYT